MKKRILLIVIASFMFMGVVSAASMWGSYKGNNIILLTVDNKPVKVTDVPVISYQGRTMVPIYLLKEAGVRYEWDQYNQTVNIIPTAPPQFDTAAIREAPISWMVLYTRIMDIYRRLSDLSYNLQTHHKIVFTAMDYAINSDPKDFIVAADESHDFIYNAYNELLLDASTISEYMESNNLVSDFPSILENFKKSLDNFDLSLDAVGLFNVTNQDKDYDVYRYHLDLAKPLGDQMGVQARLGYDKYINLIVNYK